ncbi:hybrid sensor histidine kinase/response regulator [Oscillatoria acuminata]|uniref:histidine kinase n=1 Tax=Oscillatoria acuminata PCC 6304 TaxID=56110 RepID=K9TN56_9CYAN|nr:hybrid sensor histidine kinase/response regulator [Oscillatoria acuminata]AFY83591.1 chemotaxis protein histidine kinase-like protein [Oscillatoria acuminata PCC 6304]
MQPEQRQRIMGYFIEETTEHLNTIEQGLQNLASAVQDPSALAELFRAAHSVKGGAGMLELTAIQQIAHKLEDEFKVLQLVPVEVDPQLESLFVRVFRGLQETVALIRVSGPLDEEKAAAICAEVQPAINQLHVHLAQLAEETESPSAFVTRKEPRPDIGGQHTRIQSPKNPGVEEYSAKQLIFKSDVSRLLQEMIHLFKQAENSRGRERMQEICRQWIRAGEQFDLKLWCHLIDQAATAIANPENTFRVLAPILIKEIQKAREQVLCGQAEAITVSPKLEGLLQPQPQPQKSLTPQILGESTHTDSKFNPMSNNSSNSDQNQRLFEGGDSHRKKNPDSQNNQTWGEEKRGGKPTYNSGPEVGAAELNTLADLFEGESSYFDENWEGEEVVEEANPGEGNRETLPPDPGEVLANANDFDDLLFEPPADERTQMGTSENNDEENLANLFGLEGFVEMDDSSISEKPQSPSGAVSRKSSNQKLDDLGELFEEVATEELKEPDDWEQMWDDEPLDAVSEIVPPEPEAEFSLEIDEDSEFKDLLDISGLESSRDPGKDPFVSEVATEIPIDEENFDDLFGETTEDQDFAPNLTASEDSVDWFDSDPSETLETEEDLLDLLELETVPSSSSPTPSEPVGKRKPAPTSPPSDEFWLDFEEPDSEPESDVLDALDGLFDDEPSPAIADLDLMEDSSLDSQLFDEELGAGDDNNDLFPESSGNLDGDEWDWDLDPNDSDDKEDTSDFYQNLESLFEEPTERSPTLDLNQIAQPSPGPSKKTQSNSGFSSSTESNLDFEALFGENEPLSPKSDLSKGMPVGISEPIRERLDLPPEPKLTQGADIFTELDYLLAMGPLKATFDELEILLNPLSSPKAGTTSTSTTPATVSATANSEKSLLRSRGSDVDPEKTDVDFDDMEKLLRASADIGSRDTGGRVAPRRGGFEQTMRVPVRQLDNLSNLVGELVVNRNSIEQNQERMRQFLDNLLHQVSQLTDVGQRMQDLYERSLLEISLLASRQNYHFMGGSRNTQKDQSHTGSDWSALEMDRFTPFHSLSQDILELIVRVRESASDIEFLVDETEQVTRQLRQVTTQLQEGLTRSRMVPFAQTADRLPRGVRDNAIKFGKQVELQVEGRETLIDKMILEQLSDPMTHLVNNALAHGVETPEERRKKGKPPVGRIVVRAFHQGNQTVISVSDDGAGIDSEKVKAKALQRGLISPEVAKIMTRLDVYDLLFMPGFSTRDKADDLAGRGVGMDVVRTSLSSIRGVVTIDSTLGKGTTFTIRLPLTLSISKALCCISDRARIAFPMDGVEDMIDVPRDRIKTQEDGQTFIPWRDTMLPFRHLRELLVYNRHLGRGVVYGANPEEDIISVVVLRSAGNFLALQVDQVLGEQEIVIKQLEGPVPKPVGVAGATVMGDGRIVAIADVLELLDLAAGRLRREGTGTLWEDALGNRIQPEPEQEAVIDPTVLIVDDSITVRELLSLTFNKAGYRVEQARDGQEAWEKMRSGLPCDLVFCDIEMPRMDGLELLSRMQKDPILTSLPIAMLTSRGADKHRQMAIQMGASGYFTKPYLEESLLEAAGRMLKGEKLVSLKMEAGV